MSIILNLTRSNALPLYLSPEDDSDLGSLSQDLSDLADDPDDKGGKKEDDDDSDDSQDDDDEGKEEDPDESDDDDQEGDEEGDEEGEEKDEEDDADDKEKGKKAKGELDEHGRPTYKTIKAKYPEFFKDYPTLRAAFFEYPKYQEIFPDIEEAKVAANKAQEYDQLEAEVAIKGDPTMLLKTLSENNPKSLRKLVGSFADAVRDLDPELYKEIAIPIVEELLHHANSHATKVKNSNLALAAKHIANYVFANGGEIPDISKRAKAKDEPSEAEKALQQERETNSRREFERAANEIGESAHSDLGKLIDNKLDTLTPFERKQVIKETRLAVDKKLKADKSFQTVLSSLWRKAKEDGYSEQSKSRIKRAWLDRARTVAPVERNRLRQEALDARTPGKGDSGEKKAKKRQFDGKGGKGKGSSSGFTDPSKINWKKTSDIDILDS